MLQWGVAVGLGLGLLVAAGDPLLALVFTRDAAVRDQLRPVLLAVALMQPLGGAVFVLDGILIGAGDVRYLALAMAGATLCFPVVRHGPPLWWKCMAGDRRAGYIGFDDGRRTGARD